jgi:hypothetical protein
MIIFRGPRSMAQSRSHESFMNIFEWNWLLNYAYSNTESISFLLMTPSNP